MLRKRIYTFFNTLENVKLGWGAVILSATSIISLRIFLEVILSPYLRPHLVQDVIFFESWFLALFFSLAILISFAAKKRVLPSAKLLVFGLPIILIPLVGLWQGRVQAFTWPQGSWGEIFFHVATLLWFHPSYGTYFTMEIALFLIAIFTYLFYVSSFARAVFGAAGAFFILVFFALYGKIFGYLQSHFSFANASMTQLYIMIDIIILLGAAFAILWRENPEKGKAFMRRFRPKRIFFGIALSGAVAIGALLAPQFHLVNFIFSLITFGLFLLYATVSNDIADIGIDVVSNPERPYASGIMTEKEMRFLKNFLLISLFVFAAASNSFLLLCITLLNVGLSVAYSPLHMRKYFFAFVIAALGESTAVLYGYFGQQPFFLGSLDEVVRFFAVFFALLCLFLPVKDLKDREGDLRQGVRNIVTVFPWEKAKMIIAIMVFLGYLGAPLLLWGEFISIIAFLPLSLLSAFFVFRYERFGEQPLYFVFLLSIFLVLFSFMV